MSKSSSKHPPQFFLSLYGWTYWFPFVFVALLLIPLFILLQQWIPLAIISILLFACLAFYRDFNRPIPTAPDIMVAPADGKVTEITQLPHYAPFNGPALKVSIFLSVLDVHVNRSPCDGTVLWTRYEEGLFLDARHPDCSEKNQSNTIALGPPPPPNSVLSPQSSVLPVVILKQIVGAIARRIIAPLTPGESLSRGQRFGMIAFGSRTELYVPTKDNWQLAVPLHTHVKGGQDILLKKSA